MTTYRSQAHRLVCTNLVASCWSCLVEAEASIIVFEWPKAVHCADGGSDRRGTAFALGGHRNGQAAAAHRWPLL
jgi:hypothetical protein